MKTVLSFLLATLFGQPVFGEDLKVYAAAAFKSPLSEIATQYEAATNNKVTPVPRNKNFATILKPRC